MIVPHENFNDTELLDFLGQQESQDIYWASHYREALEDHLSNGPAVAGDPLPWPYTDDKIRLRAGEVSLWAGMNGHKKSLITGQVALWLSQAKPVGVMSFEMPVLATIKRMAAQAAGCTPAAKFAGRLCDHLHNRVCFYDQLNTVPPDRVLGVLFYMAKELGCKHIFIDSLTKCGLPSGDRDCEKRFMDTLSAAAKSLGVHIHIVAHVRKPMQGGEDYRPNKFDIRGAGELTDLVDNVFLVWSNKKRAIAKKKKANGVTLSEKENEVLEKHYDQLLTCAKQRHSEWEGTIGLYFHEKSMQLTKTENKTMPFSIGS